MQVGQVGQGCSRWAKVEGVGLSDRDLAKVGRRPANAGLPCVGRPSTLQSQAWDSRGGPEGHAADGASLRRLQQDAHAPLDGNARLAADLHGHIGAAGECLAAGQGPLVTPALRRVLS